MFLSLPPPLCLSEKKKKILPPKKKEKQSNWGELYFVNNDSKKAELFQLYFPSKLSIQKADVQKGKGRINAS